MEAQGWNVFFEGWPWFRGAGRYPISAYSEFMPPPRVGGTAYGGPDAQLLREDDPWGWPVNEYEEGLELSPGMARMAQLLLERMVHLANGQPAHGVPKEDLEDNPYWPDALARRAGALAHERLLLLLPLSLARTQDDKVAAVPEPRPLIKVGGFVAFAPKENVEPDAAEPERVTGPVLNDAEHVPGQVIPVGSLVTVPLPVPVMLTVMVPIAAVVDSVPLPAGGAFRTTELKPCARIVPELSTS